jgi:hypothetical protein
MTVRCLRNVAAISVPLELKMAPMSPASVELIPGMTYRLPDAIELFV